MKQFIFETQAEIFFKHFDQFLSRTKRGLRLQKNGMKITKQTYKNYVNLKKVLLEFCHTCNFQLRLPSHRKLNNRRYRSEKRYWKIFYFRFTDYLYENKKFYDNYVGSLIKLLNCFFKYQHDEYGSVQNRFLQVFYPPGEEIQILVLSEERHRFLIHDKEFENTLSDKLKEIKDIYVFGCWVALRVSDLMALKPTNIELFGGKTYLNSLSNKTQTNAKVWLPPHLLKIIKKYKDGKYLLPQYDPACINLYGKILMEKAGWTETFVKYRQRRGVSFPIYKNPIKKTHYRFCDLVSSHIMRRTAITTMIASGASPDAVRVISGHAPGSIAFFRYITLAQTYLDQGFTDFFQKMELEGKKYL